MTKEFLTISDGTFTLQEGENKNEFYFYRNDGGVLTDIDYQPMDLFHAYIMCKMNDADTDELSMSGRLYIQKSDSGKTIRLTFKEVDEKDIRDDSIVNKKQPNFLKRLLHKIFG